MNSNKTQGARNRFGIAPSSLLIPERHAELIKTLNGFDLLVLLGFEQPGQADSLSKQLPKTISITEITMNSLEPMFENGANRQHFNSIIRLVAVNQNGHSPALETYGRSQIPVLTLCGTSLKDAVHTMWERRSTLPYPQSILCIGPHVLITTWLEALLANQMAKAQNNDKIPFKDAISDVQSYETSCGLLEFSTERHMVLKRPHYRLVQ
jgi:hypothetical protein